MDGSQSMSLGTHGFQANWSVLPMTYVVRHDTRKCQLCSSHHLYHGISYASTSILDFAHADLTGPTKRALGLHQTEEQTHEACLQSVVRILGMTELPFNPWHCSDENYSTMLRQGVRSLTDGTGTTEDYAEMMERLNKACGEEKERSYLGHSYHPWCYLTMEKMTAPTMEWLVLSGMCLRAHEQ